MRTEYFGRNPIARISVDTISASIRLRKEEGISSVTVNMEIAILCRVLKRVKRWRVIAEEISRLTERRDIGRALTFEGKRDCYKWWQQKQSGRRPGSVPFYLTTTMRGCGIRGLRWRDIDFYREDTYTFVEREAAGVPRRERH